MPDPPVSPLLLEALFDDASLFPPASLPMDRAVAGHLRHQAAWYAPMCGPFVCPDTRLGELAAALRAGTAGPGKIALSVIVTGGPGRRRGPPAGPARRRDTGPRRRPG
jgi:hypothetical protein